MSKPTPPTPEETVIAKPAVRLTAILYDGMLILAMLFVVGAVLTVIGTLIFMDIGTTSKHAQELPRWYRDGVMSPAFVLTLVGFYGLFWRKSGQTLGMQTWRLKVVDAQGQLLTWKKSFARVLYACLLPLLCAVVGAVIHGSRGSVLFSAFLGFLCNYLFCLLNARGLAVHDILSGTLTLKIPKYQHQSLWQSLKQKRQNKS